MSDTEIPKQYEYDSFDGYVDALEEFARVASKGCNEALQLARELQDSLARVVSWWDKIDRGADEMEDSEVNIIANEARAALTKANQLLK